MRVLIDTSVLVEAERRAFDLGAWVERQDAEIYICDAGVAELLAGKLLKDEGKRKRFHEVWESFVCRLPSLPLDRNVCERAGALCWFAPGETNAWFLWETACMVPWLNLKDWKSGPSTPPTFPTWL